MANEAMVVHRVLCDPRRSLRFSFVNAKQNIAATGVDNRFRGDVFEGFIQFPIQTETRPVPFSHSCYFSYPFSYISCPFGKVTVEVFSTHRFIGIEK